MNTGTNTGTNTVTVPAEQQTDHHDSRPVNVFVSPAGNAFMADIASWITQAAAQLGRTARLLDNGALPCDPAATNLVVAPHEFYTLADLDDTTIHAATQISVPVATEQPGNKWFELTRILVANSPLVLDINAHGAAALARHQITAFHLRLGGVPAMDATSRATPSDRPNISERYNDVLFLGGLTERRAAGLGQLAPMLWDRTADLRLFSFSRPVDRAVDGLVFGADKYALLADSRILINIHRDDTQPGYFEWARMVEAMANGVCVLTDPVAGYEPFVDGEHFVISDSIATTLQELLDDPDRVARIGATAQAAVLGPYRLATSLAPLLARADAALAASARHKTSRFSSDFFGGRFGQQTPKYRRQLHLAQRSPLIGPLTPFDDLRDDLFDAAVAETKLQRQIARTKARLCYGDPDHVELTESAAYRDAKPQVSVVVTVYNYADVVTETLDSIASSRAIDYEIVVVDDHATDNSRQVVSDYLHAHPAVPILLVGADSNRGLPGARNLGFGYARAPYVMTIDADNHVYPTALAKLTAALDADPQAAFAYSIMEEFGAQPGLRSAMSWDVPRLTESNYIDAQAMFRKSIWQHVGGYSTGDLTMFGWEDWELWLRLADQGYRGVHVREILGRYRVQTNSMLSTTAVFAHAMFSDLMRAYPNLPWP